MVSDTDAEDVWKGVATMTREEAVSNIKLFKEIYAPPKDFADALDMAIKALQGDMYCPNCGVRLVPENEYLEPTQTHGRLIDADALSKKLCGTTIFIKDGEVFQRMINDAPTVQADRPHGEWIEREDWNGDSYYDCSVCGESFVLFDGTPSMNLYHYCPNCGADMRKEKE